MRWLLTLVIALAAGFGGAAAWDLTGLGGTATRDYLLANPEVLPEAMDVLQQREQLARIEPMRAQLETPFPGAVLGNPQGKVTLVEFTDYACGYCRQSVADVDALIAANPDLKVVMREYPILSPGSVDAARMASARRGESARSASDVSWSIGDACGAWRNVSPSFRATKRWCCSAGPERAPRSRPGCCRRRASRTSATWPAATWTG